ncbi:tyrosine-type recombinase/integrase [Streptomyces rimosus]|uniref:tyrosine-type recombinase/integrase n=1 Tax=Streptomyces rimosus TaxID=1927 RepID=UPI0004C0366F|nr:tyrosine-type recombinase/integrase [Streptomyces rimosus]
MTELVEQVIDAELVTLDELAVAPEPSPVQYKVDQHTVLGPGQLPPRADETPGWTDADFRVSAEDIEELSDPDLAENTLYNRKRSVAAFEAWCAKEGRVAWPCTTATYTAYGLELIRRGKQGEFAPDTVRQYMNRIYQWQPEKLRPDPTRVRAKIRIWRKQWKAAGGEVRRAAALTIPYLLKCLKQCDESTHIGIRDAFALALAYHNLHRRSELTDLLEAHIKIMDSGLVVTTATSKTDTNSKGSTEFLADRPDTQLVRRARAWFAVREKIGAGGPRRPVFMALTVKGNLASRKLATKRGEHLKPGAINDRVQLLADRAGVPYIAGKKVTAHSLRAGPNTDMIQAGVPLAERNRRGRWSPEATTADTVYDRPHNAGRSDPLAKVPVGGYPAD